MCEVITSILSVYCNYTSKFYETVQGICNILLPKLLQDWWTTSCFSRYYRRWNRVVYSWLRDHLYVPLAPTLGRPVSTFIVFAVTVFSFFSKKSKDFYNEAFYAILNFLNLLY